MLGQHGSCPASPRAFLIGKLRHDDPGKIIFAAVSLEQVPVRGRFETSELQNCAFRHAAAGCEWAKRPAEEPSPLDPLFRLGGHSFSRWLIAATDGAPGVTMALC